MRVYTGGPLHDSIICEKSIRSHARKDKKPCPEDNHGPEEKPVGDEILR